MFHKLSHHKRSPWLFPQPALMECDRQIARNPLLMYTRKAVNPGLQDIVLFWGWLCAVGLVKRQNSSRWLGQVPQKPHLNRHLAAYKCHIVLCFSISVYCIGIWLKNCKRNSSPKNLIFWPQIQDVDKKNIFIGTDFEKFSITSLAHQWILCSEWVPSEWESKQLIKTLQ